MYQNSLSICPRNLKHSVSVPGVQDCQINSSVEACSTSSYQAPIVDQTVGSSTDSQPEDELNLFLWKLRANQVQHILSVPHGEDCPLYSYSRCKKAGIDFNVGSGVKQNLDPKLLTNGIMVELDTFATALQSAQKEFITDILEYNFELNLKNELCRSVFAFQIFKKCKHAASKRKDRLLNLPFELPDLGCIEESTYPKSKYCPKCYRVRNSKLCMDESDPVHVLHTHPHAKSDTVSAEANCTAQKPATDPTSTSLATEKKIMNRCRRCKKIGLSLSVDKNQPKEKLGTEFLTRGIIKELFCLAKIVCGRKLKIINDVVEHNFSLGMQSQDNVNTSELFMRVVNPRHQEPSWFDEVFVVQPCSHKNPGDANKLKKISAMQRSERKETASKLKKITAMQKSERKGSAKQRQLALQTKKESTSLPSNKVSAVKPKKKKKNSFPLCEEIGLDLDVTCKSRDKEKLDLKLLTRAVMMEIYTFSTKPLTPYFPGTLYDILDYNFDLSSQHDRHREFALEIASKVKDMAKHYRKYLHKADEVFELPFVFKLKSAEGLVPKSPSIHLLSTLLIQKRVVPKSQNKERSQSFLEEPVKTTNESQFARPVIKSEPWGDDKEHGFLIEQDGHYNLQGKIQTMKEEYNPYYGNMEPELDYEEKYYPHCENAKPETKIQTMKEEYNPYYGNMEPELDYEEKYYPHCENAKPETKIQTMKEEYNPYYCNMEPELDYEEKYYPHCENAKPETKIQTMKEEYNPYYGNMEPELDYEEKFHPHCENAKLETNIKHVEYLVPGEPAGPLGHMTTCQTSENNLKRESETRDGHYYILAEPQASVGYDTVCPHTWSSMPTELDAERVEHVVPAETAGSQEFSMITVSWNTEGAQIKEEQEYVPDESYTY
uniref:uncharacterized protein LOC109973849 n=1 Tax=Monopterus albus TaxID=43700 RepID=UPI0009B353E3|nr:uncharacterized protein LOC109973849 [Monopterus albus]